MISFRVRERMIHTCAGGLRMASRVVALPEACRYDGLSPVRGGIFVEPRRKNISKLRQERHLPRMANTYTQIYIHVVFAVEGRQNLIPAQHNVELQKYITGIMSGQKQKLIAVNNMPDHLHLLLGLRPDSSLSDLVRDVKASSSKFINEKRWMAGRFSWQEGFGAFSYSRSQIGAVIRYIEKQQEHHARKSFRQEYVELLEKFNVDYDRRYIFEMGDE
jgi:putative transposase